MKLRAHPIVRGGLALSGLALMALGLLWSAVVLGAEDSALRLEHLVRASPVELGAVAVVSVPLLAVGVVRVARAPLFGITCTDTEVRVHKVMWTRRVPTERITEIRRTWTGKIDLRWETTEGWPRWTRVPAFSLPLTTRRVFRQWLEPYNDQCVATLRGWIEQETRTGRTNPHP
ncbi:hypothetical protein GCM10009555_029380 [Acrocarpospora macrocephala]|uniref:Uncharacterized protein n=1 Tax=Acrocarpospora macrocephala TaxID=150177 RepID=A0A5M3WPA3_9ACTN|nr:hypothetical protein [Acrocarpospora macrocephala]GES11155.1 hypothetical protein Amac_047520 [Acrocarpospora macrocephala]